MLVAYRPFPVTSICGKDGCKVPENDAIPFYLFTDVKNSLLPWSQEVFRELSP